MILYLLCSPNVNTMTCCVAVFHVKFKTFSERLATINIDVAHRVGIARDGPEVTFVALKRTECHCLCWRTVSSASQTGLCNIL